MTTGTAIDVVMPQMGVSVSEGTVTKWLKSVGETVAVDEALLEISTDKVDTEVPTPVGGVVSEILVQEGETVVVGTVLARITEGGAASAPPLPPPLPAAEPAAAEPVAAEPVAAPEPPAAPEPVHDETHTFVSPVVARIAAERGIDPHQITGSGKGGRVTKKDILAFVETPVSAPAQAAPPVEATPGVRPGSDPGQSGAREGSDPGQTSRAPGAGESTEPMSAMRRGIADHMRRSLDTAAHVTSAIEVDMSHVVAIREKLKGEYVSSYGVNPTYLAFIARATVETLRDWPWVNGELRDGSIVTHSYVNLGFAVSLEGGKGLIVPVVKNAEGLNLLGMARAIADVAERARSKKLNPDDVTGGTFTITNPGSFGTFMGTPVISQPQSGILGTYAVVKRPWVIQDEAGNDAIGIRPIMNLTLTYDHRLVDGAYGAQFLRDLAQRLQTWTETDY